MTIEDVRRLYCAAALEVRDVTHVETALWFYAASVITGMNGVRLLEGADFTRPELAGYTLDGMRTIVAAEYRLALTLIENTRRERFPGVTASTPETT